tara:strand:+ start:7832 stop:8071 length:240 start_codon:yes stop_codon:yes gene_type:complete
MLNFKHKNSLRILRNSLLQNTDKCMMSDYEIDGVTITPDQLLEIKSYRKELKDITKGIPAETDNMNDIPLPIPPTWFKG